MINMFRKQLRLILAKAGFGVYKLNSFELFNFWNILHLVLDKENEIRYLQIGANDGVLVDPMYEFVCRNHKAISGLLVEPIEIYFQRLKENYRRFPKILPIAVAIHTSASEMTMYMADSSVRNNDKGVPSAISSFDRSHLLRSGYLQDSEIVEIKVPCTSVFDLLTKHKMLDINVLIIDTEGYDFQILSALDLDQIRPKVIRFEHGLADGTMSSMDFEYLIKRLNGFGYQTTIDNNDAIAALTSFIVEGMRVGDTRP